MAQNESKTQHEEKASSLIPIPPQIAAGANGVEALIEMRKELIEKLRNVNRSWFDRVQSETNLASELASKLTSARSIPETTTAIREWTRRRVEMSGEDAEHFLADTHEFMKIGTRFWSRGLRLKDGAGDAK